MTKRTEKFKNGDVVPLDCVYDIIGIIPNDAYEQADMADQKHTNRQENDAGETIRFIKNVVIKIDVVVT